MDYQMNQLRQVLEKLRELGEPFNWEMVEAVLANMPRVDIDLAYEPMSWGHVEDAMKLLVERGEIEI
jgi:hypothetical protein